MSAFPEEHFQVFKDACWATWNTIANDVMQGEDSVERDVVIEMVLDADRVLSYGMRKNKDLYDNVIKPWVKENYGNADFDKVMHRIFYKEVMY